MKKLPSSIDFMLLGTCNLSCPFCFGPSHFLKHIDIKLACNIIQKLAKFGVKQIVFTGGEPTLIRDLDLILTTAKNQKMTVVLSTNGILLNQNSKLFHKTLPLIDWLAIPLEGDSPQSNSILRIGKAKNAGEHHFYSVIRLLQKIKNSYPSLRIKIGTVVTNPNKIYIDKIPQTLLKHDVLPNTWKLYQISPSEYGKINYDKLKISDNEYMKIFKQAKKKALKVGILNIVKYSNSNRSNKYFFINPRAEVLVINKKTNDYMRIGNFVTNFEKILSTWKQYINPKILEKNFHATYPKNNRINQL